MANAFIQNAYPIRVGCDAENLPIESQEQESMLDETVSVIDLCAERIKGWKTHHFNQWRAVAVGKYDSILESKRTLQMDWLSIIRL